MTPPVPPALTDPAPATRAAEIYAELKGRLLSHRYRMGDVLREEEVASWFGASRLPARDAMRQLEHEGLIERSGRRYRVRHYDYHAVQVTYRMRAALEHMSVELAVARGGAADFDRLAANLDAQERLVEAPDRAQFTALDIAFHLDIARLGGNPMLVAELSKLLDRVRLIRSDEIGRDNGPAAALEDHRRILHAIRRGDAASAKAELDYHYATTVRLHDATTGP
ncbi:GntR family transcriptional regulator [Poseidonocella sp. HB161398]|uniref:GntR family transcriptional regulator n=1 Tax=Poseidonocella sp. HB161398 TaxID=2320855 RepID=UPI0014866224|nr:GntR family transcriptional regulator [Poseidonocella sp. HB161398]